MNRIKSYSNLIWFITFIVLAVLVTYKWIIYDLSNLISVIAIIASSLALFKEWIMPLVLKPEIEAYWFNDTPCQFLGPYVEFSEGKVYEFPNNLGVLIKNVGKTDAKGVHVKLIELRVPTDKSMQEKDTSLIPTNLNWVRTGDAKLDITKHDHEIVKLAYHDISGIFAPAIVNRGWEPSRGDCYCAQDGDYIFKIAIYGENFMPKSYEIPVERSSNYFDTKFAKERREPK